MQKKHSLDNSSKANYLTETGVVTAIDKGFAFVKTQRTTGCSGCSSESGCGTSALAKLFVRERTTPIKVQLTVDCAVGDEVELLLDESRLLKHSFMAYGLPLIGLFLGAMLMNYFGESIWLLNEKQAELLAITGAVFGLLAGWKVTQKYYKPVLPELGRVLKKKSALL